MRGAASVAAAVGLSLGTTGCAEVAAYYAATEIAHRMQAALDGKEYPTFYRIDTSEVAWDEADWERYRRSKAPLPERLPLDMEGVPEPSVQEVEEEES